MLGQSCPKGQFVSGFDQAGRILCRAPDDVTEPPPNAPPPVSLPAFGSAVAAALRPIPEQTAPLDIQTTQSGISLSATGQLDTAFCSPTDVQAAPPYNCAPQVTASFTIDTEGVITGTVVFDSLFLQLTAEARAEAPGLTMEFPVSGYLQLQKLHVDLSARSEPQTDGTRRVTGFSIIGEGSVSSTGQVSASGVPGAVADFAKDFLLSFAYNSALVSVKQAVAQKLADATASLPPVVKGP
jgi:hypothetical protein